MGSSRPSQSPTGTEESVWVSARRLRRRQLARCPRRFASACQRLRARLFSATTGESVALEVHPTPDLRLQTVNGAGLPDLFAGSYLRLRPCGIRKVRPGAFLLERSRRPEVFATGLATGLGSALLRFATGLGESGRRQAALLRGVARRFVPLHGQQMSGEGGIRTHEAAFTAHAISSRAP